MQSKTVIASINVRYHNYRIAIFFLVPLPYTLPSLAYVICVPPVYLCNNTLFIQSVDRDNTRQGSSMGHLHP